MKQVLPRFSLFLFAALVCSCTKPTDACFDVSSSAAAVNAEITFNASCSQSASYYTWNFGDNTGDTSLADITIMHRYSAPGIYTVTLEASRKDGVTLGKDKPKETRTITVQ